MTNHGGGEIAVIGMSCRVPGANSIDEFWRNLRDGVESISLFSDEELLAAGADPTRIHDPRYVRARGILRDVEWFDPAFFGLSPREAELMDPQHRLFLEGGWEALEHAGYDPAACDGSIGVFAGAGMNTYLLNNLYANRNRLAAGGFQVMLGNDRDFLATRLSYRLNLRGPSLNVQSACSTSLVAVHLACQSLLDGECDMALAGGVSIRLPQTAGYEHEEGMIFSPDGHCRAFDARAAGTVSGNGMGVVVLKPLDDALADGDCVHAVIKGSAINNDGIAKVGYTAPGIDGQASVIAEAQAVAGVDPESITYVEAHGTGTELGDPIEIAALTRAFRSQRGGFCGIGSVKTNIGHLDSAAGVIGLIKTVLALEHATLPPSLHFERPNPKIDFAKTPFYVVTSAKEWDASPRRAGVSAFGIGGTNAHVVLEEAPANERTIAAAEPQLLVLSARSQPVLDQAAKNLAAHLETHRDLNLADVAFTLRHGRRALPVRREIVCRDVEEAIRLLRSPAGAVSTGEVSDPRGRRVPLPTYPFERQRCWVDASPARERASVAELAALRIADPADWFYVPVWKQSSASLAPVDRENERWLIFADEFGIGHELAECVRAAGGKVMVVEAELRGPGDFQRWIADASPRTIVHLRALHATGDVGHALERGFNSLLFLAQALGEVPSSQRIRLAIVSNNVHDIVGGDLLAPEQALLLGPATVIPLEYPNIDTRGIDIALPTPARAAAEILMREVPAPSGDRLVAWRGGKRWVREFERMKLGPSPLPLRRGGTYVITGGSGGVGLAIANFLIRTQGANVALIARSEIADPPAGAVVHRADVTDAPRMREVIDAVRQRFGAIHGVIHAAGIAPDALIHNKSAESAAAVLAPKVRGTLVLKDLFEGSPLDFLLLCSSLRSIVPAAGMVDYVAANAFLDAFAAQQHAALNSIAVNWEGWREVGMGVRTGVMAGMDERERAEAGMSTAEGLEAFRRIVENPRAQIAVSMHDLPALARAMPSMAKAPATAAAHARPDLQTEYVAPRNDLERTLANLWQELLGVDRVGIHDNFIELGGDSILSLQLIARARQEGLEITPRQIFEQQTIAGLAGLAGKAPTVRAEQTPVSGPLPLTPIQRWFFEQQPSDPQHYNQSLMLEAPLDMSAEPIEAATRRLVEHHDALRLRFSQHIDEWGAHNEAAENAPIFETIAVSDAGELRVRAAELQASLDLTRGPLIRVALFRLKREHCSRLLIVIHHLCVDAVSWRFLLQDLFATGPLPPKTTSFKQWAKALAEWAHSHDIEEEFAFWNGALPPRVPSLPVDHPAGSNNAGDANRLVTTLTAKETELFEQALRARNCRADELLLAAFSAAFRQWTHHPGLLIDVEGLGREVPIPGIDVSRTAGWFTSIHPIFLTQPTIDAVKHQLRSVPNGGTGYGVLRYLTSSAAALRAKPRAEVSFTYLGNIDAERLPAPLALAVDPGPAISARMRRRYLLEIECSMTNRRVQVAWVHSEAVHRRSTIARLQTHFLEALRSLFVQDPGRFANTGLDAARVERLVQEIDQVNRED